MYGTRGGFLIPAFHISVLAAFERCIHLIPWNESILTKDSTGRKPLYDYDYDDEGDHQDMCSERGTLVYISGC